MQAQRGGRDAEDTRVRGPLTMNAAQVLSITDHVPAMISVMTPDGELESSNQRVLEYFGTTFEELRSWSRNQAVHADDLSMVLEAWTRAVERAEPYEVEHRMRRFDGVYRWFQVRGQPLRGEDGKISRWCVLCTDIDAHKRAEEISNGEKVLLEMIALGVPLVSVLETLCKLLDAAVEGSRSGVVVFDGTLERVETVVAPAMSDEYVRGLEGQQVRPEAGPWGMMAKLKRPLVIVDLATDTRWDNDGWPARARKGGIKASWAAPVLSQRGEVLGAFALNQSKPGGPEPFHEALMQRFSHIVSIAIQRVRSEDALERARSELAHVARVASLGVLTASIAHEVNQPLSGIITNASTCRRMLSADPPDILGASETARRTLRDGSRAVEVIAKLRTLFAKRPATRELVDLNEAAREVLALLRSDLLRRRVCVHAALDPDLPAVRGDRVQLQQVILNVVLNAADAMTEVQGRPRDLSLCTEPDGPERVRLTVRDTGVGIDAESGRRLFDAFYTTKRTGMGIGLSVSRSIVESHGGSIWAEPNEGPGTTVAFSVPRADVVTARDEARVTVGASRPSDGAPDTNV